MIHLFLDYLIILIVFNGYVLGFVAELAVKSPKNPLGILILWKLVPHGIFELPAILISIGLGIKLGLYPFFVREKGKGILSLVVSLLIFLFLTYIAVYHIYNYKKTLQASCI